MSISYSLCGYIPISPTLNCISTYKYCNVAISLSSNTAKVSKLGDYLSYWSFQCGQPENPPKPQGFRILTQQLVEI
jgi:hypothetical protein